MSSSKKILISVLVAASTLSAGAFAQGPYDRDQNGYNDSYDPRYDNRNDGRYEDPDAVYDYAKVVDVQPLTTRVRVSTPRRECWDETRYDNGGYAPGPHGPQVAGSTLFGAVIGAAIGNQIGHGHGRHAATAAGAIIGAGIGHDQGMRRYGATVPPQPYTVQRCETRYNEEVQERVDGYRVTYLYHGRRQVTELPYKPGERIRVRVDVTPAE
jgi:uncharacterized protein YcfJ